MIERVFVRELHGFDETELELADGLVVFTGPSGAGKSILMQAILANFGYGTSDARLCEVEISSVLPPDSEEFELEEPIVIKAIRKERARYYINGQNIPHKKIRELFRHKIRYLSVRDRSLLESSELLRMIDAVTTPESEGYEELLEEYRTLHSDWTKALKELERKREEERKIAELIDFTRFEIEKISSIEPVEGEYEELMRTKQRLSRIDRVNEALHKASMIFDYEESVNDLFSLLEKSADYFSEALNQLRIDFEEAQSLAEELQEVDIESLLNRLEKIDSLVKRHGSIREALEYREEKRRELEGYLNIEKDMDTLEKMVEEERERLADLAEEISSRRKRGAKILSERTSKYLETLKLPPCEIIFEKLDEPGAHGMDRVSIRLGENDVSVLSGGEFNRLRLALMSASSSREDDGGIIFLDEIDANVSGDESIAIADMIAHLSRNHQIFAISHQAHLSSQANQHIVVRKDAGKSVAYSLEEKERIREIARIISGEKADREALAFAEKLRKRE